MERKEIVIDELFPQDIFDRLVGLVKRNYKNFEYNEFFGRYGCSSDLWRAIMPYFNRSVNVARDVFESPTLLPSYALACHYEGDLAELVKHKDNNACTYTIDLHLYSDTDWPLIVEGREYILKPNQALAFYGEEQEHWRPPFPNKEDNGVGAAFFHFVEPEHWFFTGEGK